MKTQLRPALRLRIGALAVLVAAGCGESHDARLAQMAQRSLDEQARQNERLAQQSQQIAEASKHLVEADAESRNRMAQTQAALQREIETARANVDRGREELEQERREMALYRHRDPILAQAIGVIGLTIACLLPLLLAGYVLYSVNRPGDSNEALGELLVAEMTASEPLLLPPLSNFQHLENRPLPSDPDEPSGPMPQALGEGADG